MMRKVFLSITLMLLLSSFSAYAGIYGILKGTVKDDKGEPVIGASVRIEGTNLGAVADYEGRFTVLNLSPKTYNIKVTAVGFGPITARVSISADEVTKISIELPPDGVTTEDVIIRAKMVENTEVGSKIKMNTDDLQGVAAEGITSVVGLSAGVINSGGGFMIRGARSTETQIRVDGLDVGNQFSGGFGLAGRGYYPMVSSFATEQVQVLTGGFTAEYGDAMGGIVNTIVRTGSTDFYEGFFRYRTDIDPLWGSQSSGVKIVRDFENGRLEAFDDGPGYKLQGPNQHQFEVGIGGPLPIPFFKNSTFYISSSYMWEEFRNNTYEIYDDWGNNIGRLPSNESWVKNITGRMKFAVNNDIDFIVGGMYGLTNLETMSWGWLYAQDEGLIYDKNEYGFFSLVPGATNGIPEYQAKSLVADQLVYNAMIRINHRLTDNSFYELTFSNNSNNDDYSKRKTFEEPGYFSGFDYWYPQDTYIIEGSQLVPGNGRTDNILDPYEPISAEGFSSDGYLKYDQLAHNPLTGYIEGAANSTGTNNPWGLQYFTNTHGNERTVSFRRGNYWQLDGNYTLNIDGEKDGFNHIVKSGFEARLYEQHRHMNSLPWDGSPFFDVYTDMWGGNIYADSKAAKEASSEPYRPYRGSLYLQDQISYKGIIFSPGLRFDYFNPNSDYRTTTLNFVPIGASEGFAETEAKYQVSPRVNVTYPITEQSNFSINYGMYFKMPELQTLYDGFAAELLRGNQILGQPNMDAQRTNAYQISYNSALSQLFALNVTAFYRDIYNQLGIVYVPTVPTPFFQYSVSEYGNAKGLEIGFRKDRDPRAGDPFYMRINYTLQTVVGTSSSATGNYLIPLDPFTDKPTFPLSSYPMSGDIRHQINAVLGLVWGNDQGPTIGDLHVLENTQINLTTTFRSGTPYTRLDRGGRRMSEINAERNPSVWSTNMRLSRAIALADFIEGAGRLSMEIFVDVNNLFNNTAAVAFNPRTGDPIDNGSSFDRQIGHFSQTPYYKDANFGMAETFSPGQYDNFGNRLYNENADFDGNGIVTQEEKYQSYLNFLDTQVSFRGNFMAPRTVYAGLIIRF